MAWYMLDSELETVMRKVLKLFLSTGLLALLATPAQAGLIDRGPFDDGGEA